MLAIHQTPNRGVLSSYWEGRLVKKSKGTGNEPQVKGVAFRSVCVVAEEILGTEEFSRVLMKMPIEERHMFQYSIVNTGWYPTSLYSFLLRTLRDEAGGGDDDFIKKIGAASIRRDINGVYRMIFKVFSPETVFSVGGRMFNSYYSHGRLEIDSSAGEATARYTGCLGFERVLWTELAGTGEELVTAAGGKDARMEIISGGEGSECTMRLRWR